MDEFSTIDINTLAALDKQNALCADCRQEASLFASINNAILICRYCATRHKVLGFNVSYVREIASQWDEYLLSFIRRGGNSRFLRFAHDYQLSSLTLESKYKTKAAEYYRKLILSEVLAEEPPKLIMRNEGLQYYSGQIFFNEFENYQLFTGEKKRPHKASRGSGLYNSIINTSGYLLSKSKSNAWFITEKTTNGLLYIYSTIANGKEEEVGKANNVIKEISPCPLPISSHSRTPSLQSYNYMPTLDYQTQKYYPQYQFKNQCEEPKQDIQRLKMPQVNPFYNSPCNVNNNHQLSAKIVKQPKPNEKDPYLNPPKSSNYFPDIQMIDNSYINEQIKQPNYNINPYTQSIKMNINTSQPLHEQTQIQLNDSSATAREEPQKDNENVLPQLKSQIINDSNITPGDRINEQY